MSGLSFGAIDVMVELLWIDSYSPFDFCLLNNQKTNLKTDVGPGARRGGDYQTIKSGPGGRTVGPCLGASRSGGEFGRTDRRRHGRARVYRSLYGLGCAERRRDLEGESDSAPSTLGVAVAPSAQSARLQAGPFRAARPLSCSAALRAARFACDPLRMHQLRDVN